MVTGVGQIPFLIFDDKLSVLPVCPVQVNENEITRKITCISYILSAWFFYASIIQNAVDLIYRAWFNTTLIKSQA